MKHDKRYKILAVDDEDNWQNVCKEAFKYPDYELLLTKNMKDAVELIKDSDGVIVNLHFFPEQYHSDDDSGRILLDHIKEKHPFLPRIVFTADYRQDIVELIDELKFDNIVFKGKEKDFDPSVLRERMKKSISKRTKRVFISYARENFETAERIYNDLKKSGAYPWLDRQNLLAGENWKNTIAKNIKKNSDYFLTLLSSKSASKRGFVHIEQKIALKVADEFSENKIFIIPVRLDNCELPEKLEDLHCVDLFSDYEEGMKEIFKALIGKK